MLKPLVLLLSKKTITLSKIPSLNYFSQFLIVSVILIFSSCGGARKASVSKSPLFQQLIEKSLVFERSFSGFVLFDPETEKTMYTKKGDHYFTPASNTKIFTFYTCLQILGDSIPAIRYVEQGDSLIFWGTGDPSLRHPYLSVNDKVVDFLKKQQKNIYFNSGNFNDSRFGAGWAWDDYYYSYQPEKAALPFHGNIIKFVKIKYEPFFRTEPGYFSDSFSWNEQVKGNRLKRIADYNIFEYNKATQKERYENDHPFIYSDELAINLLNVEIQKSIQVLSQKQARPKDSKVLYSVAADSLYKRLMKESDNLIAEQLLLVCSDILFDDLNTRQVIDYAKDSLFQDFPDEPIWADGSGLSRYNLFTPRSIVHLLNKLYQDISTERLFNIFPAGGVSGTIEDWYEEGVKPYIYAKTGTLSNNHCLSGYLVTSSGKTLIFSFMHNNFKGSSKPYKQEMEKVLRAIHLNY
ncbi:MAG: D-alanyl-D-alanine carboxypeptidase/D-alanyl-D-alanine-endopeptidase (penicillin-binding protein 4) [Saprospiraceae bacterium]|jgi:D-alanyl-D-alanine carboxypeptidase/D-alanyl-D-alanine-endopeptidase (penicillin-binding protein 4)